MMNKIMSTTQPVVGSPVAPAPKAAQAQAQQQAKGTDKGTDKTGDDQATAFAALMQLVGQHQPQQQTVAQAKPAEVPAETPVEGKAGAAASEAKTLDTKSLTEKTALMAAGAAQAPVVKNAAGTNAGAQMIAGLQPKAMSASTLLSNSPAQVMQDGSHSMKEWVFDGVEGNPNLRSLFGTQASAVEGGENLGNKIPTELQQQVRGELAKGAAAKAVSSDPLMTSAQGNVLSNASATGLSKDAGVADLLSQAGVQGHAMIDRQQPQMARQNGSQALSGAEFLSTLSALKGAGQGVASQGQSGAGSFGSEGGKAGLKSGINLGDIKKQKLTPGAESATDSFATNGTAAAVSGSAILNGARTESSGKPAETQNVVQAHVTTGSMAQDRIASASVYGMSTNIRDLAANGQGGEMRVKLHPENLGELHLRVVTNGNQVGLQIHASDDKARKILEQSLGDLKDSLSKHQLSLGQIDIAVGQPQSTFSSDMGSDSRQNASQHSFMGQQDMMNNGGDRSNQWAGSQEGASSREGWNSSPLRTAMPSGAAAARMANASGAGANGVSRRLDVRA